MDNIMCFHHLAWFVEQNILVSADLCRYLYMNAASVDKGPNCWHVSYAEICLEEQKCLPHYSHAQSS